MKTYSLFFLLLLFFCFHHSQSKLSNNLKLKKDNPPALKTEKLNAVGCSLPNSLNGVFSQTYWQTGDFFENGNGGRTHYYWISFGTTLCYIPRVHLSLTGFDTSKDYNQRLVVSVYYVFTTGFYVQFDTWADTKIYLVRVEWLAAKP